MAWATFSDAHVIAIGEMLTSSSERVLAVVGGALLEDSLYRTLSERFKDDPVVVENVLERPLGNPGPQIDVLYLLDGIDGKMHIALKAITKIRIAFSHNLAASFASEDVVKFIDQLNLHKDKTHYPHHLGGGDSTLKIESVNSNRERCIVNLQLGLIALMRDHVTHKTHSNERLTEKEIEENKKRLDPQ